MSDTSKECVEHKWDVLDGFNVICTICQCPAPPNPMYFCPPEDQISLTTVLEKMIAKYKNGIEGGKL